MSSPVRTTCLAAVLVWLVLGCPGSAAAQATTALQPPTSDVSRPGTSRIVDWTWFQDRHATATDSWSHPGAAWPDEKDVTVPHTNDRAFSDWNGTIGWYRTSITLPAGRHRLHFGNVQYHAQVWVDGQRVADHTGGWTPFHTSSFVSDGQRAVTVVVRADNRHFFVKRQAGGVPVAVRGWWNWGGLLRDVHVRPVDEVDVTTVRVNTRVGARHATVQIEPVIETTTGSARPTELTLTLDGKPLGTKSVIVPASGRTSATWTTQVSRDQLWRPGHGRLHQLAVSDRSGQTLWQGQTGFRQLKLSGGRLRFNGRPFRVAGIAIHDQVGRNGGALTAPEIDQLIADIRALGANTVRAHYLPDPRLVDALDRHGIVLWAEAPVTFLNGPNITASWHRNGLQMLRETVDGASWRPSAAIMSIGNEHDLDNALHPKTLKWQREAVALVRTSLPAITVTYSTNVRRSDEMRVQCRRVPVDFYSVNNYIGWYFEPRRAQSNFRRALNSALKTWRRKCGKPIAISEVGAEAGFDDHGRATSRGTVEHQAAFLADHLRAVRRSHRTLGAIVWILHDFAVIPGWQGGNPLRPRAPYNQKGLIDPSGRRKPAWATVRTQLRLLAASAR